MTRTRSQKGFTLTELIVVVLIIGILAAFGLPSYMRTVESGKADDAIALMSQVATTNRMFALDHANQYVTGQAAVTGSCQTQDGGTLAACPTAPPYSNFCNLVRCKYLADRDWSATAWDVAAAGAATGTGGTCAMGSVGTNVVACVKRKSGASPGTSNATYNVWWYSTAMDGTITKEGTAPAVP